MERKGACKRCGKCCQTYYTYGSMKPIEKIIVRIKVFLKGGRIDLKDKCRYLYFKKGKAICKNYASRPGFCKDFPDVPTNIDGCGYYFTKGE